MPSIRCGMNSARESHNKRQLTAPALGLNPARRTLESEPRRERDSQVNAGLIVDADRPCSRGVLCAGPARDREEKCQYRRGSLDDAHEKS